MSYEGGEIVTNIESPPRPLPRVREIDKPYWEGCRQGELRLQRCGSCQEWRFPPEPRCPNCLSGEYSWEATTGKGTVWSWIVMHRKYFAGLADLLPYNVALIQLDEGPLLMSNFDVPNDEVEIGTPVEVFFETISADFDIPRFRPVGSGS
jgi:uncharacterized OB-fold protein